MKVDLRDIIAASICRFNVGIDIDGKLDPQISTECCEQLCDYCRMAAQYIFDQIEEDKDGK